MNDIPGSELTTQDLHDIDMLEDRFVDGKQMIVDYIKFFDTYEEMIEHRLTIPKSKARVLWCENPTFRGKNYNWILVFWHT
jgi:hypothetical protein